MYTRRNIRWSLILRLSWSQLLLFIIWSTIVVSIFTVGKANGINLSIPISPLGTIGIAVAFYVGFKNNQSYDRNWEARKVWGGIVNVSRSWGNQVLAYVADRTEDGTLPPALVQQEQRTLIYRHLAWIHSLRFQLRRKTPFGFEPKGAARKYMQQTDIASMRRQLSELLQPTELTVACTQVNSATQILRLQGDHLRQLNDESGMIEEFRFIAMMNQLTEMYTLQGKCERIKNTPFPRQYAYFSQVFTWIFVILLPFGLVGEFDSRGDTLVWLTVPISVIVSWIFFTMETVGDSSEDPFENFLNDVPMTAICRTIEIDLRQMLSEPDIPAPLEPVNDILM